MADRRNERNQTHVQQGLLHVETSSTMKADVDNNDGPFFCSQRWILVYNGLFFGILLYVFRVNVSITIVSMAAGSSAAESSVAKAENLSTRLNSSLSNNWTYMYEEGDGIHIGGCKKLSAGPIEAIGKRAEFDWDSHTQSFVLSAYFYGYMVSQVPGGWLSGRYGGKHVISISLAISSAASLLSPVLARLSVYGLIAARVVTGICGGASISAWFALVGVWALPTERSRFTAIFWFGQITGTVVGYTTSGFLCDQGFDNGWGSVFYIDGIAGFICMAIWLYCVHNSPEEHPRITDSERRLLARHLKADVKEKRKTIRVPWLQIITSPAVIAVVITNFSDTWLLYVMITCLPLFLSEVLNFEIKSNGLFSSLPFMTMCVGLATSGVMADYISARRWLRTTSIRKLFQITGNIGMAAFVVASGFISCERRELVILCLCLCTFMEGIGVAPGYPCNPIDMAPRYAGIIYGMSSTIASIPGIVAPVVVAELTKHQTTEEWRLVFYICAGLAIFAAVIYGIFSSSDPTSWSGDDGLELVVSANGTYNDTRCEEYTRNSEKCEMLTGDAEYISSLGCDVPRIFDKENTNETGT